MQNLKVSSASDPKNVAGAIAAIIRSEDSAEIHAIGAAAVNQTMKSIAIARSFVSANGIDLICIPGFAQTKIDGEMKTIMKIVAEAR